MQGLQGTEDIGRLAEDEIELRNLCTDCDVAAETLLGRLNKLKVSKFENNRRWKSLQHGLLAMWSKNDILSHTAAHVPTQKILERHQLESVTFFGVCSAFCVDCTPCQLTRADLEIRKRITYITGKQPDYFRSLSSENQETSLLC
jgi:hypothetical protein